jgi:hypothetical protein
MWKIIALCVAAAVSYKVAAYTPVETVVQPIKRTAKVETGIDIVKQYNGNLCLDAVLKTKQIDKVVLMAVLLTESRYYYKGDVLPNPWAVNYGGKGVHYKTRAEALAGIRKAIKAGQTNIDVGCGQLNYRWHKDKFKSLEEMIDPYRNVHEAEKFLMSLKGNNSWMKTIAMYHNSVDKAKQQKYLKNFRALLKEHRIEGYRIWN